MTVQTVAGPFTREQAEQTAAFMGPQHSICGVYRTDEEGFTTSECDYYVERDDSIVSDRIVGLTWAQIQTMQRRR